MYVLEKPVYYYYFLINEAFLTYSFEKLLFRLLKCSYKCLINRKTCKYRMLRTGSLIGNKTLFPLIRRNNSFMVYCVFGPYCCIYRYSMVPWLRSTGIRTR